MIMYFVNRNALVLSFAIASDGFEFSYLFTFESNEL